MHLTANPTVEEAGTTTSSMHTAKTLPLTFGLRFVQMLLTLVALKLTHQVLSAADFVVFNAVLFALAIASGAFAPSLRAVWRVSSRAVAVKAGAVNVLIGTAIAVLFLLSNRTLFESHTFAVGLLVTTAAGVYCAAKATERMVFAYGFMHHRFGLAYGVSFLFIAGELVATLAPGIRESLIARLLGPATAFWLCCIVYAHLQRSPTEQEAKRPGLAAIAAFVKTEYATVTGMLTVVYSVLFAIFGMLERLYPTFLSPAQKSGGAIPFSDYLLVLAYGVAFQSLLSIAVDWARPSIIFNGHIRRGASKHAALTVASVLAASAAGCVLGFVVFQYTRMLPRGTSFLLWSLILGRATAGVLLYLTQVDLVVQGHLVRASLPWFAIIVTQMVLMGRDLSVSNLQRVFGLVVPAMFVVVAVEAGLMRRRLRVVAQ